MMPYYDWKGDSFIYNNAVEKSVVTFLLVGTSSSEGEALLYWQTLWIALNSKYVGI